MSDFINIYLIEIENCKTKEVVNLHSLWDDYNEACEQAIKINETYKHGTVLHAFVTTRCLNLKNHLR